MTCLMERTSKSGMGQRTIHQQGFKGNSCKDLVLKIMMQHIGGKRSATYRRQCPLTESLETISKRKEGNC